MSWLTFRLMDWLLDGGIKKKIANIVLKIFGVRIEKVSRF